jgi:hypothetical protein
VLHKIKGKILVGIGIIFWGFGPIKLAYSRHFFLIEVHVPSRQESERSCNCVLGV